MLFRKMLRDILNQKAQFISIFLMSFLGVFIYSGISGEWMGLRKIVDNYYESSNIADLWIYGKSFSETDMDKLQDINGVENVTRRLVIDSIADFNNNPKVTLYFMEENIISKPYAVSGEEFDMNKDGVWLDSLFAKEKKLDVGDEITFKANNITIKKQILGLIMSPEYVYPSYGDEIVPNHNNYGFAYLPKGAFPKDIPMVYTNLIIKTKDNNYKYYEDKISLALNNHYSAFISKDTFSSVTMFEEEIKQHKAMATVFPTVFLAIAVLTILTTMTRIVNNQRSQIGTLKALGYKKKKILLHYVSYGLYISLLGAILGGILGPITLPYLFYDSLQTTYTLPDWEPTMSIKFVYIAIIAVLICIFATIISCINNLKDTPAQTLRPKYPKTSKQKFIEKTKIWEKVGFNIQWNFRDIFRSKIRSIMAIVGVFSCTALLVCALGLQDSLDNVIKWQYTDINRFNSKITMKENSLDSEREFITNSLNGEEILEEGIEIKANGYRKTGSLLVKDNTTLIRETGMNGEFIDIPKDKISISYKMAEVLNVKVGDEISWHLYGDETWNKSIIGGIYRNPTVQGIIIEKEVYTGLGYDFKPSAYVTKLKIEKVPKGAESVKSVDDLTKSYKTLTEAMNTMVYVLIIAAIILALVVLYNLSILSFTEMEREIATLKVIGFKSNKIRNLLLTQNIVLTTIGIIIGIPTGKILINYIISFLGDSFDMMAIVNESSIIYSILITFIISITVNLMFTKKIRNIDMVTSLKSVE